MSEEQKKISISQHIAGLKKLVESLKPYKISEKKGVYFVKSGKTVRAACYCKAVADDVESRFNALRDKIESECVDKIKMLEDLTEQTTLKLWGDK